MAKVIKTIAPIDSLSGAFGKREQALSGKVIIANVRRKGGNWNGGAGYMYMSCLSKSTYVPTENGLIAQNLFARRAEAVRERMTDTEQLLQDQAAYKEQTKYKTFNSFVWSLVIAQIPQ